MLDRGTLEEEEGEALFSIPNLGNVIAAAGKRRPQIRRPLMLATCFGRPDKIDIIEEGDVEGDRFVFASVRRAGGDDACLYHH